MLLIKNFTKYVPNKYYWKFTFSIFSKQDEIILINVSELKTKRLKRQLINSNQLGEFESQRLWSKVSAAIANEDQVLW